MTLLTRTTIVLLLATVAVSCGGDSPIAPSSITPAQQPPPVVVRTLSFQPDVPNVSGSALSIQIGSRGSETGKINLAIMAHNIPHSVYKVRGELRWDPAILEFDAWGQGEWLNQGGALVDWTFFTSTPGELSLFLDRPSTLGPAGGSGEVFLFRLRPRAGITSGNSRLQWNEPRLLDTNFRQITPNNIFTGTVTVQ